MTNPLGTKTVAVIGVGNIGRILLNRLRSHGAPAEKITLCDTDPAKVEAAAKEYGTLTATLPEAACSDVLLLAAGPKAVLDLLPAVARQLQPGQLVVSFAAAVPMARLESLLPPGIGVVRVMPNAPSLVGKGMNPVVYGQEVSPEMRLWVEALLGALGDSLTMSDEQMNWCVGLSGAAMRTLLPALEGMAQAGIEAGLLPQDARRVAAQVMLGTAALALETGLEIEQIKALTPMQTLDEAALAQTFLEAARAAKEKVDQNQKKLMEA